MEKEHYNLYYLFLEDKLANPMSEARKQEILDVLIKKFEKNPKTIKPIENLKPLNNRNKK